jgi:hypothetical protein
MRKFIGWALVQAMRVTGYRFSVKFTHSVRGWRAYVCDYLDVEYINAEADSLCGDFANY